MLATTSHSLSWAHSACEPGNDTRPQSSGAGDDPGGDAHRGRAGRDIAHHHGVGPDAGAVTDGHGTEDLGASPDEHVIADDRAPVAAIVPADGPPLVNLQVGSDPLRGKDG